MIIFHSSLSIIVFTVQVNIINTLILIWILKMPLVVKLFKIYALMQVEDHD